MDLITPAVGQLFWGGVVFITLLILLKRFAWKPILNAVNDRAKAIEASVDLADRTKAEMKALQQNNEQLLKEARIERDNILKEATQTSKNVIEEAKDRARQEVDKIMADAQQAIRAERKAAVAQLKTETAALSLEIAEQIIKGQLSSDSQQKELAEKLVDDLSVN